MTELKTLREVFEMMILDNYAQGSPDAEDPFIKFNDSLRQEAINWIKHCTCKKVKITIKDNDEVAREVLERDFCFACLRFKIFFNINEEELK